jgi:virulence-associated protein VapD
MRCALVKIDLDRLTLRLRVTLGRAFNEWDVRQWLEREGFKWASGAWYTCQETQTALMADETLARQTRETTNGITFIEHPGPPGPHAS